MGTQSGGEIRLLKFEINRGKTEMAGNLPPRALPDKTSDCGPRSFEIPSEAIGKLEICGQIRLRARLQATVATWPPQISLDPALSSASRSIVLLLMGYLRLVNFLKCRLRIEIRTIVVGPLHFSFMHSQLVINLIFMQS
jgi:hypothetical protein